MFTSASTSDAPTMAPPAAPSMLARIMVPLDGSGFSQRAIPAAESLAARTGADLYFVRVNEPLLPGGLPTPEYWRVEAVREALDDLGEHAGAARARGLEAESYLLDGSPVDALCAEARRSHADLIVMSTHGRTGVSRTWLGSTADGVARHADTPVLLVRPGDALDAASAPLAIGRMLVALDGSREAEGSLALATTLAQAFEATVTLLRVVRPVLLPLLDLPMAPPALVESRERTAAAVRDAELYLEELAMRLRESGVRAEALVVTGDEVGRTVARTAEEVQADIVVLSSHARGASRLFFGSVADAVLRRAHGAVLLVRATH